MKQLILSLGVLLLSGDLFSQNLKEISIELAQNQSVELRFKYAELIQVSTWKRDEVQMKARVLVNGEDASEDFKITKQEQSGKMVVTAALDDEAWSLNNWIKINDEEQGTNITLSRNGKSIRVGGNDVQDYGGVEMNIMVELMIPEDHQTKILAKYGLVELLQVPQQLEVDAKYGGIDAKMETLKLRKLKASTSWGQIYTNLEGVRAQGNDMMGKAMLAVLDNAKGSTEVVLDSKYGDIFLRKKD